MSYRVLLAGLATTVLWVSAPIALAQSADPLYLDSLKLLEQGQYPQAIEKLERLTRLNAKDQKALQVLGQAYVLQNQLDLADATLKLARELNRDDPQTHFWLAQLRYRQKDYGRALSELKTVQFLKMNTPDVFEALARTYAALGQTAESQASLQQGLALPELNASQKAQLWLLKAEQSPPKEALVICEDILALQIPEALRLRVQQLQLDLFVKRNDPESVIQLYFQQLEKLAQKKQTEAITQLYAEMWRNLARFPDQKDFVPLLGIKMDRLYEKFPAETVTRKQLIAFYRKNKELEKVLALYQADLLSASAPQRLELLRSIADLHLELNNMQFAYDNYQRILEVEPDDLHALNQLGLILIGNKDYSEAIRTFEKALKEKPTDDPTRFLLAFAYALNREPSKAEQQLASMRKKPSPSSESMKILQLLLDYQSEKALLNRLMHMLLQDVSELKK